MYSLMRSSRIARGVTGPRLNALSQSPRLFSSQPRLAIKEDKHQDPHELDRIKHEQIEKQKRGEGHWHPELASSSEENVGADKEHKDVTDHDEHMDDLQEQSANKAQKEHPHGK